MPTVDVFAADGQTTGSVELDDAMFGVQPNVPLMHQVVTAQLAAARSGTQSAKTRAEVRGGGAKPFRQKGTGRARAGSSRAPHWQGGGVAFAPKPRTYKQRTPKKMIRGALASALSDRAADAKVIVVDNWSFSGPRTREARAALRALGLEGRIVVVVDPDDELTIKCFRNLPEVHLLLTSELNAYDVLCSDWIVFTEATLPGAHHDTAPVAIESSPRVAGAAKTDAVVADKTDAVVADTADEPEVDVPEVPEEIVAERAAVDAAETEADVTPTDEPEAKA
jgi:large subunit ribosomal protein L4